MPFENIIIYMDMNNVKLSLNRKFKKEHKKGILKYFWFCREQTNRVKADEVFISHVKF